MAYQPENLVAGEAERHGPHHDRHNAEIVKLAHRSIDAEPMHASASIEVDHLHTTPRFGVGFGELLVECQVGLRAGTVWHLHDMVVVPHASAAWQMPSTT